MKQALQNNQTLVTKRDEPEEFLKMPHGQKARILDEIYNLIAGYAAQGLMLPKPHSTLYEKILRSLDGRKEI